ncbi:hypothetical protein MVEN_02516400 [Mycena venus]|uniref:Uncharacterized protein n=1 Tax=Mycena venus TaxID=2733690 RepID=A0A8H6WUI5_9AGAR|nr:hypothetical protein MVEN_02516400 [Mycena venus]
MLGLCLRSYWIEMASTTLLYTLREAQLLFLVLFTIQFFILRGISRFYPFTSDSSTGPYLKPPNFGLVNSGIFWRSYQHLGMELGAQVFLSLIFCPSVCLMYTPKLCDTVNTTSLYDFECKLRPFQSSGHYLAGWPTTLLFGHVVLPRKINSLRSQILRYLGT